MKPMVITRNTRIERGDVGSKTAALGYNQNAIAGER